MVPIAHQLGWPPSEFWRATWHDVTSAIVAADRMAAAMGHGGEGARRMVDATPDAWGAVMGMFGIKGEEVKIDG